MFGFDAIEGHCSITFYDGKGKITGCLSGPPGVIDTNKEMSVESWVEGKYSSERSYVVDGVVRPREEMNCLVNGKLLKNLPIPCEVFINNSTYHVDSSEVELDFDQPGMYKIKVSAWPFLDAEFEIEN